MGQYEERRRQASLIRQAAAFLKAVAQAQKSDEDPLPEGVRSSLWEAMNQVAGLLEPGHFLDHILPRLRAPQLRQQGPRESNVTYGDIRTHGVPVAAVLEVIANDLGHETWGARKKSNTERVTVQIEVEQPTRRRPKEINSEY